MYLGMVAILDDQKMSRLIFKLVFPINTKRKNTINSDKGAKK